MALCKFYENVGIIYVGTLTTSKSVLNLKSMDIRLDVYMGIDRTINVYLW